MNSERCKGETRKPDYEIDFVGIVSLSSRSVFSIEGTELFTGGNSTPTSWETHSRRVRAYNNSIYTKLRKIIVQYVLGAP